MVLTWLTIGRMGQLGKIHVVNTKAYLEAGRYVMVEHGGYTDAEVDVLSMWFTSMIQCVADSQPRLICKTYVNMPCIQSGLRRLSVATRYRTLLTVDTTRFPSEKLPETVYMYGIRRHVLSGPHSASRHMLGTDSLGADGLGAGQAHV